LNSQEILKQFIVQDILNDGSGLHLDEDDNLLTSGLVDSLGIMRLINHIEQTFGLSVPPEDVTIENFRSIRVIAGYIESRVATAAAA
jgi:acyl carrier protein